MNSSGKPLTFAAMLVRAQRRFEAMGLTFPQVTPASDLDERHAGAARLTTALGRWPAGSPAKRDVVAG